MPRKFGMSMDLKLKENHEGYHTIATCPGIVGNDKVLSAEQKKLTPSGSSSSSASAALIAKRKAKAMSIATAPGKQIFMNAFMLYMSGKTLNIFSISVTSMAILSPLKGLFSVESAFANLDVDTQMAKLIYVACNLAWLGLGLYKMSSMRLLPTTSADWAHTIEWKEYLESSSIPPTIPTL